MAEVAILGGQKTEQIEKLRAIMLKSIITHQPHCGLGHGATGVFAGCYDWHSAVHAHWALHCMARVTDDTNLRYQMLARLRPGDTVAEIHWLEDNPHWEMPYGQAWWLLLSNELLKRKGYGPQPHLEALHDLVEQHLVAWLQVSFNQPQIFFSRQHDSWLLTYCLLLMSQPSSGSLGILYGLYDDFIEESRESICSHPVQERDFVHLPSVLTVIDFLLERQDSAILRLDDIEYQDVTAETCHQAGWRAMHFWPIAMAAHKGDVSARVFLDLNMAGFFSHTEQWQDDFSVSHWVPQFLWMAIWLSMGRP